MRSRIVSGACCVALLALSAFVFGSVGPVAERASADGRESPLREPDDERPVTQRFAGGGAWRGDTRGAGTRSKHDAQRPWFIHAVERDDGSVRAKLSVPGVPGFDDLTVEGQLIGEDAFGVLLDSSGAQVGTFNVKLGRDGNGGTFILGTGEAGEWSYDAATRDEVRKAARTAVTP